MIIFLSVALLKKSVFLFYLLYYTLKKTFCQYPSYFFKENLFLLLQSEKKSFII